MRELIEPRWDRLVPEGNLDKTWLLYLLQQNYEATKELQNMLRLPEEAETGRRYTIAELREKIVEWQRNEQWKDSVHGFIYWLEEQEKGEHGKPV